MAKKDKNNQNINSIPKYLWGNYFKKPIKWLAHLINNYGNSKLSFITTGTSYAYAIADEKRKHPELTELQIKENVDLRIKQNRKKLGLPTENTPSLAAAGLALGSLYYPWLAVPDIIFDTAASIDEPSTSNNLHTIADFPETVAKFTPSKIDDYVAKGILTLGNIDDAVSTSGRNIFSIFDKKTGKINNTVDKTSVRESTNIKYRKNGGQIRKMQTAAGGPIKKFRTRDINGNWVYMDMKTGKTTSANPESGTIRNNAVNSVGGDNKTKRGRTQIAKNQVTSYNNRLYKVHNYADTTMRLKQKNQDVILDKQGEPEVIQADYTPTLEAPMEIVSPEFDLLTLGRQAATSMYKAAKPVTKPTVNSFADAAPTTLKLSETLSLEQIEQAYNQAKQWHLNRINSQGYRNRALRAGFTEEEIPQLLKQLTDLINRILLRKPEEVFPNIVRNSNYNGPARAEWWRTVNKKGDLVQGIGYYNTYGSYDDAVSSFVHELGHGMTYGLNGNETSGYMKMLADQFPLINRAVKYNKSLYPEITNSRIQLILPGTKMGKYFSEPTEMLSRGYEFMRDYTNNKFRFNLAGKTNPTLFELTGRRDNSRIFRGLASDDGATNFYKNALSIGTPTGIAGTYLYNNLDSKEVEYLKQGGKMNILEFLKNGSGIHIKKKNRGKFTSYCGGKVTDECILKGKNSSNPAIRKRATFAANARKWKHLLGGMLNLLQKFLEGGKTKNSFWSKAGDFMLNSGLALNLLGAGVNAIFGNPQKKSFDESAKIAKSEVDMLTEKLKQLAMLQANQDVLNLLLLDPANPNAFGGPIVLKVLREGFYKKYLKDIKENANQQKALIDAQSQLMSDGNTSDFLTSLLGNGLNAAIGYFGNKASNNTSTTNNSGGGWTMNYNSLYGNKSNYNNFFLTGSLPKMNSVVSPNTSWLNNNPLST